MSLLRAKLHNPWQLLHPKKQDFKVTAHRNTSYIQEPITVHLTHLLTRLWVRHSCLEHSEGCGRLREWEKDEMGLAQTWVSDQHPSPGRAATPWVSSPGGHQNAVPLRGMLAWTSLPTPQAWCLQELKSITYSRILNF